MSREVLLDRLEYADGRLVWKRPSHGCSAGSLAGSLRPDGRYAITVDRKRYLASRATWILLNGPIPKGLDVDHINGNKSDDRIENLRLATRSQNLQNVVRSNKVSKFKGVTLNRNTGKWTARLWIVETKRSKSLGTFTTEEEAYACYKEHAKLYSPYIKLEVS
jgi:hypothetical protein